MMSLIGKIYKLYMPGELQGVEIEMVFIMPSVGRIM